MTEPAPRQWKPAGDGALHGVAAPLPITGVAMKLANASYVATIAAPTMEDLERIWRELTPKPFDRGLVQPVRILPEDVR